MYNSHQNRMTDHPLKVFFSTMVGLIVGSHSLLNSHPFANIAAFNWSAIGDLLIAIVKAVLVGGASYFGATAAAHYKRKFFHWSDNRKNKKQTI